MEHWWSMVGHSMGLWSMGVHGDLDVGDVRRCHDPE